MIDRQISMSTGVYPKKLKMAKIIPIFKADDNTDANNYRPISLLSNFNRVFEKLIFNRMESFIEKNNLFSPFQYGFRKAHQLSTQFWILLTPYRLTWISVYFLVVFLLT